MNAEALSELIINAGYTAKLEIKPHIYGDPPQVYGLNVLLELRSHARDEVFTFAGNLSATIDVYPMLYQIAATYIESKKGAK